ncbi:Uncharacterised protein [uncultured archaeon]|nr:Uncharacterised protein [uncultured archaeon]
MKNITDYIISMAELNGHDIIKPTDYHSLNDDDVLYTLKNPETAGQTVDDYNTKYFGDNCKIRRRFFRPVTNPRKVNECCR